MTDKEIKDAFYQNNEVSALYWGAVLVWKKSEKNIFAGKFVDTSTATDWKCKLNSTTYTLPVNPNTKEFNFEYDGETLTNLYNCFEDSKLERLDSLPDTSNVNSMNNMFYKCLSLTALDISGFNTSNVTNMGHMFYGCINLTTLDLSGWDTSNVVYMGSMFMSCNNLTTLDLSGWDTSNVVYMGSMFYYCRSLTALDISGFNTSNVTDMSNMFSSCGKLTDVTGTIEGIKVDLDLKSCPLTNASAMVFINGLANVTSNRTLKLSTGTYNTLTPEQIAVATDKGWTVTKA